MLASPIAAVVLLLTATVAAGDLATAQSSLHADAHLSDPTARLLWDAAAAAVVMMPPRDGEYDGDHDLRDCDFHPGLLAGIERFCHAEQLYPANGLHAAPPTGETPWYWTHPDSAAINIAWARQQWSRSRSLPRLEDCRLLPDHATARECMRAASAYGWDLIQRRDALRDMLADSIAERNAAVIAELDAAISEAYRLESVWRRVCEAQGESAYGWLYRRNCLDTLRERLGPAAYYAGQMPPALPYWRLPYLR